MTKRCKNSSMSKKYLVLIATIFLYSYWVRRIRIYSWYALKSLHIWWHRWEKENSSFGKYTYVFAVYLTTEYFDKYWGFIPFLCLFLAPDIRPWLVFWSLCVQFISVWDSFMFQADDDKPIFIEIVSGYKLQIYIIPKWRIFFPHLCHHMCNDLKHRGHLLRGGCSLRRKWYFLQSISFPLSLLSSFSSSSSSFSSYSSSSSSRSSFHPLFLLLWLFSSSLEALILFIIELEAQ